MSVATKNPFALLDGPSSFPFPLPFLIIPIIQPRTLPALHLLPPPSLLLPRLLRHPPVTLKSPEGVLPLVAVNITLAAAPGLLQKTPVSHKQRSPSQRTKGNVSISSPCPEIPLSKVDSSSIPRFIFISLFYSMFSRRPRQG
jgi:hypothetical protein